VRELDADDLDRYDKIKDTIDVWFDSGCTHQTVMGGPDGRVTGAGSHAKDTGFPADLYLEGSDQHRGWFHSSLLVSCMLNGVPPYKALLTQASPSTAKARRCRNRRATASSRRRSRTRSARDPRLWVAATDYSGELSISDEILKRVVEGYRRIRNTLRFLLANTADFDPARCRSARCCSRSTATRSPQHARWREPCRKTTRYEFPRGQRLQTFCSRTSAASISTC
jgi:isoleucyl-tRNA synthetase